MQIIKKTKWQKILFCLFAVTLISTTFIVPIVGTAASIDWDGLNYDVANTVTVRNGYLNVARLVGFEILKLLANIIDMFDAAIDTLLSINLYDLIKNQFNIKSVIYPIAWAVASLSVIVAAIFLIIKADKAHVTDFFRNLLCSIFILIALPTLVQSLSALKSSGVKDVKDSFTNQNVSIDDDGTVSAATLGETLLANYLDVVDLSITNNKIVSYDESTQFAQNAASVYEININDTLDTSEYNKKITDTIAPSSKQLKYDNLTLIDKLNLLDKAAGRATSSTGGYTSLTSLYETWNARSDDYIISYDSFNSQLNNSRAVVYAKTGGGTTYGTKEEVYCQFQPYTNGTYAPVRQIMIGDTIYKDQANTEEISTITWGWDWIPSEHSDSYWGYKKTSVFSYQKELLEKLNEYMCSDSGLWNSLPESYKNKFSPQWVSENILKARSLEQAISNIEGMKIYTEYGISFSIIEYLNLSDNYISYLDGAMTSGGVSEYQDLETIADYEDKDMGEKIIYNLQTGFYTDEALYMFHINFGFAIISMIITTICLLFAGIKISSLMFDVLFAQIIAPIVVASDVQGSGRAKQVVQNLISCNICFICVLFILRLYLWVLISIQGQYSFLVCILLTLAGAKFVIDGPDLIIKILGMDAGVKSGFATLMSLRSAGGIAAGIGRTVGKTAGKAVNLGGKATTAAAKTAAGSAKGIAGGIYGGVKNQATVPGKVGHAIGGSAVGGVVGAVGGLLGKTNAGATAGYAATNLSGVKDLGKNALKNSVSSAKDGLHSITNADKIGTKLGSTISGGSSNNAIPNVNGTAGTTSTVNAQNGTSAVNISRTSGTTQVNDNGGAAQTANTSVNAPNTHSFTPNVNNNAGTTSTVNAQTGGSTVNVNRTAGITQVNDNGSVTQPINTSAKTKTSNGSTIIDGNSGNVSSVNVQSGNSSINVNRGSDVTQINDSGTPVQQSAYSNLTNTSGSKNANLSKQGNDTTVTVNASSGKHSIVTNSDVSSINVENNGEDIIQSHNDLQSSKVMKKNIRKKKK